MNKDKIIKKYPSLCHSCTHSRKVASIENEEKGYTGCIAKFPDITPFEPTYEELAYITEGDFIGTGWIRGNVRPFTDVTNVHGSGRLINGMPITKSIKKCQEYKLLEE